MHHEGNTKIIALIARCPRCTQISTVIVVGSSSASAEKKIEDLCIHPDPLRHRESTIPEDALPERLNRAYIATLSSFNEGNWSAAVTSARRTLEGIVKYALPVGSRGGTLATQLRELPSHMDLAKPILEIADAVKEGGNIGAHFDLDRDPDREVAKACLDLLDYLMEYIYVLPKQIDAFHARMAIDDPKRTTKEQPNNAVPPPIK